MASQSEVSDHVTAEEQQEPQPQYLSRDEVSQLEDDDFYKAYREGKIERREDAWTADNFEDEMEKIPIFMTKQPTPKDFATNPHLIAMQKAFEEDYSAFERAEYHKTHGNESYKKIFEIKDPVKKTYIKSAIECYTEGLKEHCRDPILDAALLSNRAACNLMLNNSRKVVADCSQAVQLDKTKIVRPCFRAASACHRMDKFDAAIEWCDRGLRAEHANEQLIALRQKCVKDRAAQQKRARVVAARERKLAAKRAMVDEAIKLRNIRTALKRPTEWWNKDANMEEQAADLHTETGRYPTLDSEGLLSWPVLLVYPQHAQTDMIESFNEGLTLAEQLEEVFPNVPEQTVRWDDRNEFKAANLVVYVEIIVDISKGEARLLEVDQSLPLLHVLQHPEVVVYAHVPVFIVLVRGTEQHKTFVSRFSSVSA